MFSAPFFLKLDFQVFLPLAEECQDIYSIVEVHKFVKGTLMQIQNYSNILHTRNNVTRISHCNTFPFLGYAQFKYV